MAIPSELTNYRQWVVWRLEKRGEGKPTKVPYSPVSGWKASVTDASDWTSIDEARDYLSREADFFESARVHAVEGGQHCGLGFVLTNDDPFCFIDFDVTSDKAERQLQRELFGEFETYAERSPSGKGLHLIGRGVLPTGRRKGSVECYTSERYMTMTGDTIPSRDVEIADVQFALTGLYHRLRPAEMKGSSTVDEPQVIDDATLIRRAYEAKDGALFKDLFTGDWEQHYSSQSEADLALCNIIGYWTENRAQCARVWRKSALAKREKAKRKKYVERMVDMAFDRKVPGVDLSALAEQWNALLASDEGADNFDGDLRLEREVDAVEPEDAPEALPPRVAPEPADTSTDYPLPPGLIGEIAEFVFAASPRPVHEAALVGSLALMAGICGRAFNVSGTGLNHYFMLIGMTGVGKDSCQIALDAFRKPLSAALRNVDTFFGPGEFASSQGLHKQLAEHPSFVTYLGEMGHVIETMSSRYAVGPAHSLKRLLLQLYTLSGHGKHLGGMVYSSREKNTDLIDAPALTIVGDTTPVFFTKIDEEMVSEGLIPRFSIFESRALRAPYNKAHREVKPSKELVARVAEIAHHAMTLNEQNEVLNVRFDAAGEKLLDDFDRYCDKQINADNAGEMRRNMYSRAHLKALRLAALVAVGVNHVRPVIDETAALWATKIVAQDVRNMLSRFDAGEIVGGNVEAQQIERIVEVVRDWLRLPWAACAKYARGVGQTLHAARIVPYTYIQRRLSSTAAFRHDRRTPPTRAIQDAIRVLIARGDVQEIPRHTSLKEYGTHALCYAPVNLSVFR